MSDQEKIVFVDRKLGEKIKENLKIVAGELQLRDGTNSQEYLESWANFHGIEDGESVCVCTIKTLKWLEDQAILAQWSLA